MREAPDQRLRLRAASQPGRAGPVLLLLGLVLSTLAWIFGNPPTAAPDEPSHYFKAVAAGRGELVGVPGPFPFMAEAFTPAQRRQLDTTFRAFHIPSPLRFQGNLSCVAFQPHRTAGCLRDDRPEFAADPSPSIVGAYQPFVYLPAGVLTRWGQDRTAALWLARLGSAALSLGLLATAIKLVWHGDPVQRRFRLIGLVLAITPMVVFLISAIGSTGPEITASIAFTAGELRLMEGRSRAVWLATGLAGMLLAVSRPLGPLWIAVIGALPIALLGWRRSWQLVRDSGGHAWLALGLVVTGLSANVAWGLALGLDTPVRWTGIDNAVGAVAARFGDILRQTIGVFGWQDTPMPQPAYAVWLILTSGLLLAGLVSGQRRQRLVLLTAVAAAGLVTLVVGALVEQNSLGMQGRYVLPVAVTLPLLAAELLARRSIVVFRLARQAVLLGALAAVAVHLLAWLTNARRYAVAINGPVWFFPQSQWAPPGGWWPWIGLAVAAALVNVAAAFSVYRARD